MPVERLPGAVGQGLDGGGFLLSGTHSIDEKARRAGRLAPSREDRNTTRTSNLHRAVVRPTIL
jgi:hypothetical protein